MPFSRNRSDVQAATTHAPQEMLRAQVCVIGGGSGGIGASLAAARAGASVVLIEREAFLGGTSTAAWVHTWEPSTGSDGIPRELYEVMKAYPLAVAQPDYATGSPRVRRQPNGKWTHQGTGRWLPFEPHSLSMAARRLLDATGRCRVLLGATFCRTRVSGESVTAVEAWFHGRCLLIEAEVFIDSTADGDACADAGCAFHIGEDPKSRYHEPSSPETPKMRLSSCTLLYRITDTGRPQNAALPKWIKEGICPRPAALRRMPNGDILVNAVDMIEGDALLAGDLSRMMREGYDRVLDHFHWLATHYGKPEAVPGHLRKEVPQEGFGTWTIAGIAPRLGVRESRRIIGEYVLTECDVRAGLIHQEHPDIIATTDHAVDIHGAGGGFYEVPNGPYGVSYRCLLPKGVRNLLIASRAASFSHIAASSCRLSRQMMTLGQAAGNAAALCVRNHISPREVNVKELQTALQAQNVAISAGS